MPIVSGDLKWYLSGGAGNADPDLALGGARSTTAIVDATLENLFDNVSGQESADGDIEYRCFYVRNENAGTLVLENAFLWIQTLTPSTQTEVDIAVDPATSADTDGTTTATTIVDEQTAPAGVTFPGTRATSKATGLNLGNIPKNAHRAIWIRRTVDAGAAAYNNDGPTLRIEGDTAA